MQHMAAARAQQFARTSQANREATMATLTRWLAGASWRLNGAASPFSQCGGMAARKRR
jgi:hypothetical protein